MNRRHRGSRLYAKLDARRWALLRLRVFGRAGSRCRKCGRAGRLPVVPNSDRPWTGPGTEHFEGVAAPGRIVQVPQVRAKHGQPSLQWIPVRGTGIHDLEIFGFEQWHWHIDLRFATPELYEEIARSARKAYADIDQMVVTADLIRPAIDRGRKLRHDRRKRYYLPMANSRPSTGYFLLEHEHERWQRTTPLECKRPDPAPTRRDDPNWTTLQRKYAGARWAETWHCPHRGA